MTSTRRVVKYRKRQEQAGRRLVSLYIKNDAARLLRELAKDQTQGEVIEQLVINRAVKDDEHKKFVSSCPAG